MSRPQWESIPVTRRQARMMYEAIQRLHNRVTLYAEIANIREGTTLTDYRAIMEIRRRLYVASHGWEDPPGSPTSAVEAPRSGEGPEGGVGGHE